ncbi:Lens fiber membrane intrinsic protein [Apodemus speciosus]|uniref:Lens fiber membrane intrinsic protein n=1 Tax=Apodemus speciosus TaxID=105296 RepID=A0ABQ0EY71_APOSI
MITVFVGPALFLSPHPFLLKFRKDLEKTSDAIEEMDELKDGALCHGPITMYSFMGGGLFCAWVGTILLVVATATDHWMQYRLSGSFAHQGLWRYCLGNKCFLQTESIAYWNATRAFMILSALCATSGIIMGVLAFAQQSTFTRLSRPFSAGIMFFASKTFSSGPTNEEPHKFEALFVLLALAIYTGVTVSFLGRRFGDWRFSWSYILGWVALLMTFFAGIFYMCAYRMHECRRLSTPR